MERAMAAVGSVDWVLLILEDWVMIPIENIIAAANGGPTRVAVLIQEPEQVQGAAFALQLGVDALLLDPRDEALWAAAREAQAWRDAAAAVQRQDGASDGGGGGGGGQREEEGRVALIEAVVESVAAGGVGDRVCLDLIQLLKVGRQASKQREGSASRGIVRRNTSRHPL
jgi:3-dehydroquinate synthase II